MWLHREGNSSRLRQCLCVSSGKSVPHTLSNSSHSFVLIAIGLLQSEENIDLRPVGEHFANDRSLIAVLLSKLSNVAAIFVEGTKRFVGLVVGLVAISSAPSSSGETSSSTAARASTARGGWP